MKNMHPIGEKPPRIRGWRSTTLESFSI